MNLNNYKWLSLAQTKHYIQCKSKGFVFAVVRKYKIRQTKLLSNVYFNKEDIDKAMDDNAFQMGFD